MPLLFEKTTTSGALRAFTICLAAAAAARAQTGLGRVAIGQGPDPSAAARIRVYDDTPAQRAEIFPYAANYGANVSFADVDADSKDEVLSGPGPGKSLGPQVRAWRVDGSPVNRVNFFAYATLNYGVNVSGNQIPQTAAEEMITGPGPGPTFGPQVRGFWLSPTGVKAIPSVNFMAFSTLAYGARVGSGDFTGDGWDEILATPGPGAVTPLVRAYDVSSGSPKLVIDLQTSVLARAAGANLDGDAYDELLLGFQPPYGAQVRGFTHTGMAMSKVNFFAYACGNCGAEVAGGDIDGDGYDEMLVTPSGGPSVPPEVRSFNYDNAIVTAGWDFIAFPVGSYGAHPAASDSTY